MEDKLKTLLKEQIKTVLVKIHEEKDNEGEGEGEEDEEEVE